MFALNFSRRVTLALRALFAGVMIALASATSASAETVRIVAKPSFMTEGYDIIPKKDSVLGRLEAETLRHFNVLLLVNKDAKGEHAQTMTVMRPGKSRCRGCNWEATDIWDVSTGREQQESRDFTTTPVGIYQLDRDRFFKEYTTTTWDNAQMPYSMFWRFLEDGGETGWAVHAATGKGIGNLGKRNSGGCIRLHPDNAESLFRELLQDHRGGVPVFDWSSNLGEVKRRENGRLEMTKGIKALLVVEDSDGLTYEALDTTSNES